ncbi:protein L [Lelliottia wanjuensis]|uniref:Protein L n=2 Tax=Lelliottia wanjuensis TaxID=3050585 RepID=A0AAP4FXD2_9ENTR|nr:protein L [Lelliottia sp. V106_12]MDK9365439.1 protein L [Lelliottia sp. V106_12]MDK9615401.1 protein L [Lelliottia sp. V106_9]
MRNQMALVRNGNQSNIKEANTESNAAFDKIYSPGNKCEHEGIYQCVGCGKEVTVAGGKTLPPQNHHQHNSAQGAIRWHLFVYAQ